MSLLRPFKNIGLSVIRNIPVLDRAILPSAGHRLITREQAVSFQDEAACWHNPRSAEWQARAYRKLLDRLQAGHPRLDFQLAAEAVQAAGLACPTLLEVGCGNGYYSEVLARLVPEGVDYTGMDYSQEMVKSARSLYPSVRFVRGDTTQLDFADQEFDIVMDGVSLMHILNYSLAIREIARVAKSHIIFNCLPVTDGAETLYLRKYAYGAPTIEMCFARSELLSLIGESGFEVVKDMQALEYDLRGITGYPSTMRTILCRRIGKY